ncbi:MAG TPA: pyrroloquinoline quinone-dependent dehydrogenase [Terriglobia bacterium]|nr:pyrroloquinoline quinone-dependent dehydrogenase [Terriglobia bacterium]
MNRRNADNHGVMRLALALMFIAVFIPSQSGTLEAQQWPYYGGDPGGSKYSPLKQVNRENVSRLRLAWAYHTGDVSDGTGNPVRSSFECTPLVIGGIMYITTPFARVIALEAETGRQLWAFDPKLDKEKPYNLFINRGAAIWQHGDDKRLFFGTLDGRLFALDAGTGKPISGFGQGGYIDLRKGTADDFPDRLSGLSSPPLVYKDLVIAGSIVSDSEPQGPSGDVRAFDVHSGKLVWRFHMIQRPGEAGRETWPGPAWKQRGGGNAWSMLSCDVKRGILFVPGTSPSYDYYGGDRKGKDLFGNSLIALDAATGKLLWYYQLVHHDIWDYDLPAQPVLVTAHRDGQEIPAVAQVTKMGFVFLFNRVTGKPLFKIEERKVMASAIPGEQTWPTQPFPLLPAPVIRQTFSPDELTDLTPESRAECERVMGDAGPGGLYHPWGLKNTIIFPGTNGGSNWGGASFDPATETLYVNAMAEGEIGKMKKARAGSAIAYRLAGGRFQDSNRNFCEKPPWGLLTAIDLNSGKFRWQERLGVVDALLAKGVPPTGSANLGGSIVTAGGLLFIAATNDGRFRAFDKDTGKELWETRLPASGFATPMTFQGEKTGRQFIVIAAGGGNKYDAHFADALVAYALP